MSPRTIQCLKRLSCAIATVAVLMMQPNPALARFAGTLRSDLPWTVDITPEVGGLVATAVTVTFVNARGRQDTDLFTIPNGEPVFVPYTEAKIPRGTRRIIIELDFSQSSFAQLRVGQRANVITLDSGDGVATRFVFDLTDRNRASRFEFVNQHDRS